VKDVCVGRQAGPREFSVLGPSLGAEHLELWASGLAAHIEQAGVPGSLVL